MFGGWRDRSGGPDRRARSLRRTASICSVRKLAIRIAQQSTVLAALGAEEGGHRLLLGVGVGPEHLLGTPVAQRHRERDRPAVRCAPWASICGKVIESSCMAAPSHGRPVGFQSGNPVSWLWRRCGSLCTATASLCTVRAGHRGACNSEALPGREVSPLLHSGAAQWSHGRPSGRRECSAHRAVPHRGLVRVSEVWFDTRSGVLRAMPGVPPGPSCDGEGGCRVRSSRGPTSRR